MKWFVLTLELLQGKSHRPSQCSTQPVLPALGATHGFITGVSLLTVMDGG